MTDSHNSRRLHYIDICKGILILIVVLHHTFELMWKYRYFFSNLENIEKLYVPFFMPAFFVVTGFCSNFRKEWRPFIVSNFKSLIVPSIAFYIVIQGINLVVDQQISARIIIQRIFNLVVHGGSWFLVSLFMSKIILYYLIKFVRSDKFVMGVSFFLVIISSLASSWKLWEPLYIYHALGLTIFLYFGFFIKKKEYTLNKSIWIFSIIFYSVYVIVLILVKLHLPRITYKLSLFSWEIPFFMMGAITGTIVIWKISLILGRHRILEYLGKNSLIVFLTHWTIIRVLLIAISNYLPDLSSSFTFILVFILTLLSSILFVNILNLRWCKWMLGRW